MNFYAILKEHVIFIVAIGFKIQKGAVIDLFGLKKAIASQKAFRY